MFLIPLVKINWTPYLHYLHNLFNFHMSYNIGYTLFAIKNKTNFMDFFDWALQAKAQKHVHEAVEDNFIWRY